MMRRLAIALLGLASLPGLGCGDQDGCLAGSAEPCTCADGAEGTRTCDNSGLELGACSCDGTDTDTGASGETLEGSFRIANSLDSESVRRFKQITGNLEIEAPGLKSLDLPNLEVVGGDLTIAGCDDLESLAGLSALRQVGGAFTLEENGALADLDGLEKLADVGGDLYIWYNESLLDVDGLSGLAKLGGFLHLYDNPSLESVEGFAKLTAVGGSLFLWNNDSLTNFHGLRNIASIGGGLCFSNDDNLEDISALAGITHVKGDFWVYLDQRLKSLFGLHNITRIDGIAYIGWEQDGKPYGTVALENLDGFASLESVGEDLVIVNNLVLNDISGLAKLKTVGRDLGIRNNKALPTCQVEELQNRLQGAGWDGVAVVDNNLEDECSAARFAE